MFDVVIIGGGLAGWRAAEAAVNSGGLVALVANGAGNSPDIHAINIPVRPEDSIERFIDDTLASGRGACDTSLVEILCRESISLLDEFPFDREPNGSYATLQPVGCSVPRCVSINHHIGAYALARIKKTLDGSITIFNGKVANVVRNPSSTFALTLSCPLTAPLEARAVVIATGGWCGKYDFSDNPPELQGDGIAFAQSLGAAVRDMDAVQYEPTVALAPEKLRTIPVITTMLYEGATFRNKDGKEFLSNKHANKDEISHAIFAEIAAGRGVPAPEPSNATTQPSKESPTSSRQSFGVWFDATAVPHGILTTRYADTTNRYAACGIDISREPMLVAPAPHTSLGGVVIDTNCRVISLSGHPIPGLYAAGEVTGGIHGLNRIGGNAGTEVLVFGRIAGREAASFARSLLS